MPAQDGHCPVIPPNAGIQMSDVMTNDTYRSMRWQRSLNAQVINLPIHEYQHSNGKNDYGDNKRHTSKQFQGE